MNLILNKYLQNRRKKIFAENLQNMKESPLKTTHTNVPNAQWFRFVLFF